jgi:hypothetical protein
VAATAKVQYKLALDAQSRHHLGEALSAYGAALCRGGRQDFVPDAAAKAAALRKDFDDDLAHVQQFIAAQQYSQATDALHNFQDRWGTFGKDKARELMTQINAAHNGGH